MKDVPAYSRQLTNTLKIMQKIPEEAITIMWFLIKIWLIGVAAILISNALIS